MRNLIFIILYYYFLRYIMVRLTAQVMKDHDGPSIIVQCDNQKYVFNMAETFVRYFPEHRIKLQKGMHFFFTRPTVTAIQGIIAMILQLHTENLATTCKMYGPQSVGKIISVFRATNYKAMPISFYDFHEGRTFLYGLANQSVVDRIYQDQELTHLQKKEKVKCLDIGSLEKKDKNDAADLINENVFVDKHLQIVPIVLSDSLKEEQKQQDGVRKASVSYLIQTFKQSSVQQDKLNALQLSRTEKATFFKVGKVVLQDGTTLSVEDVQTTLPPQAILIVDLQNQSELWQIQQHPTFNRMLQEIQVGTIKLQSVFHLGDNLIAFTSEYQHFMNTLNCEHIYCNEQFVPLTDAEASLTNYQPKSLRIIQQLNQFYPGYFPKPQTSSLKQRPQKDHYGYIPLFEYQILPIKPQGQRYQPLQGLDVAQQFKPILGPTDQCQPVTTSDPRKLTFLGTASKQPGRYRSVSGIVIEGEKSNLLLDCGEGTFMQLQSHPIDLLAKPLIIWISHGHNDHQLGLQRFLDYYQSSSSTCPWYVIIPELIHPWVYLSQKVYQSFTKVRFVAMSLFLDNPNNVASKIKTKFYDSRCRDNTVENIVGEELDKLIQNTLQSYKSLLTDLSPTFGIKTLQMVPVIHCYDSFAIGVTWEDGYKLTYSADTRPCQEFGEISWEADIMIHESTFCDDLQQNAIQHKHSTIREAVEMAITYSVKLLVLTHFSQRFDKLTIEDPNNNQQLLVTKEDELYHEYLRTRTVYAMDHLSAHFDQYHDLIKITRVIGTL